MSMSWDVICDWMSRHSAAKPTEREVQWWDYFHEQQECKIVWIQCLDCWVIYKVCKCDWVKNISKSTRFLMCFNIKGKTVHVWNVVE